MDKSQMSAVYYHGGNAGDDLCYHNELWLTAELWYAYIYCMDNPLPCIWRIEVDEESLSLAGVSVLGDCFDPYDGLDAGSREILDGKGYDGYSFPLEWDEHILDCVVLKDTRKVISIELASKRNCYGLKWNTMNCEKRGTRCRIPYPHYREIKSNFQQQRCTDL